MEHMQDVPEMAKYFARILAYCPKEGAFYLRDPNGLPNTLRGTLEGVEVYGRKTISWDKGTRGYKIRTSAKDNRRGVAAAKLAWYMVHGEWPYYIGQKYGKADMRVQGMVALKSQMEYQATLGDVTFWDRAYKSLPDLVEPHCQVIWYPGQGPSNLDI